MVYKLKKSRLGQKCRIKVENILQTAIEGRISEISKEISKGYGNQTTRITGV